MAKIEGVTAKMRCSGVEKQESYGHAGEFREVVRLAAVTDGSEENKQWAAYTPAGHLELSIDNQTAQGQFIPGREYLVTIVPKE